jgi:hypothetical protein
MTAEEAHAFIVRSVVVTHADVVAAKADLGRLLDREPAVQVQVEGDRWADDSAAGVSQPFSYQPEKPNSDVQLVAIAKWIAGKLAFCLAADSLARNGSAIASTDSQHWVPTVTFETERYKGGFPKFETFRVSFPRTLARPAWYPHRQIEVIDADLYLRHVGPIGDPGIEIALRMSLDCFRAALYVPCVAMLGAASEGAWMELGKALGRSRPTAPEASRTLSRLSDPQMSFKGKIDQVASLYAQKHLFTDVYEASGVRHTEVLEIAQWSDVVREARNVLHWGSNPTVPNSYEKVAVLLMAAAGHLTSLHRIRAVLIL